MSHDEVAHSRDTGLASRFRLGLAAALWIRE
jgi:hypothetical protein